MKILLTIDHPAWVHQFHHIVHTLESRGDQVKVVAIDRGGVGELLESYGIAYVRCATTTGKGGTSKSPAVGVAVPGAYLAGAAIPAGCVHWQGLPHAGFCSLGLPKTPFAL